MQLKLYEYAIELANAIAGTEQNRDHTITISLLPEHLAYRKVIGATIYNQFTSHNAREVLGNVVLEHEAISRALDASRKENAELSARIAELEKNLEKPKRVVQSAPKKGNIPQKKIEKAVKKVASPKQEFPLGVKAKHENP